jgi:hypothetical protein
LHCNAEHSCNKLLDFTKAAGSHTRTEHFALAQDASLVVVRKSCFCTTPSECLQHGKLFHIQHVKCSSTAYVLPQLPTHPAMNTHCMQALPVQRRHMTTWLALHARCCLLSHGNVLQLPHLCQQSIFDHQWNVTAATSSTAAAAASQTPYVLQRVPIHQNEVSSSTRQQLTKLTLQQQQQQMMIETTVMTMMMLTGHLLRMITQCSSTRQQLIKLIPKQQQQQQPGWLAIPW